MIDRLTDKSTRSLLRQYLQEELNITPGEQPVACEALAGAAACLEGLGQAAWSSEVLALAVGGALSRAGEQGLAAQALVRLGGRRLQGVAEEPACATLPWGLLLRGVLRPDVYSTAPAPAWTLDFRRLHADGAEDQFELGRLFCLRESLLLAAPAFDVHNGRGSLILLGLEQRDPSWLATSVHIMEHLAGTRGWAQVPVVIKGTLITMKKSA